MPTEIDELEREATSLEIERAALKRENDPQQKRAAASRWSAKWPTLKEKTTALRARWTKEREAIRRMSELKKQIEALRFEAEEQTRKGNLERAAQIQYGELPKLEAELKKLNAVQDGATRGVDADAEGRGRRGGHRQDREQVDGDSGVARCWKAK